MSIEKEILPAKPARKPGRGWAGLGKVLHSLIRHLEHGTAKSRK